MVCKYLSNDNRCEALAGMPTGVMAQLCKGKYEDCPRYQYKEGRAGKNDKTKQSIFEVSKNR